MGKMPRFVQRIANNQGIVNHQWRDFDGNNKQWDDIIANHGIIQMLGLTNNDFYLNIHFFVYTLYTDSSAQSVSGL